MLQAVINNTKKLVIATDNYCISLKHLLAMLMCLVKYLQQECKKPTAQVVGLSLSCQRHIKNNRLQI